MKTKIIALMLGCAAAMPAETGTSELPALPSRAVLAENFRIQEEVNRFWAAYLAADTRAADYFAGRAQAFAEVVWALENQPVFFTP